MAKAFNGAIALVARLEGEARRSTTRSASGCPGVWPKADAVTVRADARSTPAGLPDYIRQQAFIDRADAPIRRSTCRPLRADRLRQRRRALEPRRRATEYHYSDSDNIIVGLIAEAASGQTYNQLLRARDLQAGRASTTRASPDTLAMPKRLHARLRPQRPSGVFRG